MSTKHVRTAADLVRFDCALKIDCGACGYGKTLDGFEVAETCGTGCLGEIRQRLKCSRCGAKEARVTLLSPPAQR